MGGQRQQFDYNGIANNIPSGRLDTVALAYQKLFYPAPNNTAGSYNSCTHANNFLYGLPVLSTERQGIVRSDYKLSDKDNVMARYGYYFNATNFPYGTIPAGLPGDYDHRNDHLQTQDGVLSEIHVFGPSLLNDARIGMMLSDFPFQAGTAYENIAGKVGLPNDTNIESPTMSNGVQAPNITVGFRSSVSIEGVDDLTWNRKNHTLHLGGSAQFTEGFNYQTGSSASGTFNFTSGTTAQGNDTTITTGTGSTYASYLLGQVNSASQLVQAGYAWRRMMYAIYVQDDWRVSPRLTINAGLRWDFVSQAVEKHNGIENFDITKTIRSTLTPAWSSTPTTMDMAGISYRELRRLRSSARLRLCADQRQQDDLRGGAGIYYPDVADTSYDNSSGNTSGFTRYTTSWTAAAAHGIDFQLQNGLPGSWGVPLGINGGQNAFLGQSAAYIWPHAKDPSSQIVTLTVSRELPWGLVADASYDGNHGEHFVNASPNINTLAPQYYSMGTAALSASVANPYAGIVPGSLGAATITEANLLKPYPYMSSVTVQSPRNASYWANLAELSVQRRVQHGLQIIGAYTFGKITDEGMVGVSDLSSVGTSTSSSPQNWRNPQGDHSVDAIDVTHRVTIQASTICPSVWGIASLIIPAPIAL